MVREKGFPFKAGTALLVIMLLLSNTGGNCLSAQPAYNFFYRIYFRDKGENEQAQFSLSTLFSKRAVERRTKAGITDPDFRDLPVSDDYLRQVTDLGFRLHCRSRWMNTALFKTGTLEDTGPILALPFVSDVKIVKDTGAKSPKSDKLAFRLVQEDLPPFDRPLSMLNALPVHNSGLTGEGVQIAVLDAGFYNADNITSLAPLRERRGIRGTRDFVLNGNLVYGYHNHGSAVLSVLAGNEPGYIEGSAPGADYWLLRTEDPDSEFPAEEDYWITGAEYADSAGADIISSSLGYFNFDDPLMNYKYSDFDGKTAFITRAADIAASKGIIVVNSAGNERNNYWIHIIAPADGYNVIAVGAVDGNGLISTFSSAGPTYDGRIKPDVVAQGVSVPVQVENGNVSRSAGTSFSCPVISGLCACVLQAVPMASVEDVIITLQSSSDRFLYPDSLYGYGIPDFVKVISRLQEKLIAKPDNGSVLFPNPFADELRIIFKEDPGKLKVEIFSPSGKLLLRRNYEEFVGRSVTLQDLKGVAPGVYLVRTETPAGVRTIKAIKLKY